MDSLDTILRNNRDWASKMQSDYPEFFTNLAKGQNPPFLWIGCSDSRVPVNQILDVDPGEVFVHRNIANQVISTDTNAISVIEYAVDHLKTPHLIVCGHYGCGGVKAAIDNLNEGITAQWIQPIRKLYSRFEDSFSGMTDNQVWATMSELNVIEQVEHLATQPTIQRAWANGQTLHIHGLIYQLSNGRIKDLDCHLNDGENVRETCAKLREQILSAGQEA